MISILVLAKYDSGQFPDRAFVRQAIALGPRKSAETEFFAEARSIADGHFEGVRAIRSVATPAA